jgi:anti-anti-sigma factor
VTVEARIELVHRRGAVVAEVAGEIDMANAAPVGARLTGTLADAPALVVDLTEVSYLDSQGVRVLCQLAERAVETSVGMAVVAPEGGVADQVLGMAGLGHALDVRRSRDEAVDAVRRG